MTENEVDAMGEWVLLMFGIYLCAYSHPVAGGIAIVFVLAEAEGRNKKKKREVKQ